MFLLLWQEPDGENRWSIQKEDETLGLISTLIERGVQPGSFIGESAFNLRWLVPSQHDCSEIDLRTVDVQLGYNEKSNKSKTKETEAKRKSTSVKLIDEPRYGWVSPDGRYISCGYGGHASLAIEIVGRMVDTLDAAQYLENKGWMAIYHDPTHTAQYSVGMGAGMRITDAQLNVLKALHIDDKCKNLDLLLWTDENPYKSIPN